ESMCSISLSPLGAAVLRQRLDEMGDSVIMSQVGNTGHHPDDDESTAEASYRWRVHVHVPDPAPAVALIRSLGEPTDIAVSQLALPRDSEDGHRDFEGGQRDFEDGHRDFEGGQRGQEATQTAEPSSTPGQS